MLSRFTFKMLALPFALAKKRGFRVPTGYIEAFKRATFALRHQAVIHPESCATVPMTPWPEGLERTRDLLEYLGHNGEEITVEGDEENVENEEDNSGSEIRDRGDVHISYRTYAIGDVPDNWTCSQLTKLIDARSDLRNIALGGEAVASAVRDGCSVRVLMAHGPNADSWIQDDTGHELHLFPVHGNAIAWRGRSAPHSVESPLKESSNRDTSSSGGDYSALENNTPTIAEARASTTEQTEEDQRKRKASETIEPEGKRPRRQRVLSSLSEGDMSVGESP